MQTIPQTVDQQPQPFQRRFLRPRAASAYLGGVALSTLQRWRHDGVGPKWRRFGIAGVLYAIDDLEEYLNSLPLGKVKA